MMLVALQVVVSGGHLRAVASFMVSVLWLHYTTYCQNSSSAEQQVQQQQQQVQQQQQQVQQQQERVHAAWWQASLVGMGYPLAHT